MTHIERIIAVLTSFCFSLLANAQVLSDSTAVRNDADTLLCNTGIALDSTLVDKNIFEILPSRFNGDSATVTVHQSQTLFHAFNSHFELSSLGSIPGYRVRIYFSNERNAREASLTASRKFKKLFPEHNVYRIFVTPNFKVTVGDFRTESEALALLETIRSLFPAAFVVKEEIKTVD